MQTALQLIKITKNFQITLPAKLRSFFKLKEGDYLEAGLKDGAFVFKPKKVVDIDFETKKKNAPVYNLKGKAAEEADMMVEEALSEYNEGKTIKASSFKKALKIHQAQDND